MAAEAGIANEKAGFVSLGASWAGSASTAAQARGAELLMAKQEQYRATLLAMQQVLVDRSAALGEIRSQVAALVNGDLALFWIIADDGSVTPGPLLQDYAALSPVTELQVMLMALGLEREIRQLLAEFELADTRTADSLRSLTGGHSALPQADTACQNPKQPASQPDSQGGAPAPIPEPDPTPKHARPSLGLLPCHRQPSRKPRRQRCRPTPCRDRTTAIRATGPVRPRRWQAPRGQSAHAGLPGIVG